MIPCAYCGTRYALGTFPVRIEACCADCRPGQGWPRRFRIVLPGRGRR